MDVISGVPQGSVLGPLLFVIFINDLSDKIANKCKLFADDTKFLAKIENQDSIDVLQEDMNKLSEWSNNWSINFNEDKCKVMRIGNNNPQNQYTMNGHILEKNIIEKDLGVLISNYLEWKHQVKSAVNKANRKLGMIKHTFSYLGDNTFNLLYKSIVRPHLEYASTVWSESSLEEGH
jgi:ribonuclease P/MRP protein subunit RPP40